MSVGLDWELLWRLFDAALDQPIEEREAFVERECPDPKLADELRALLEAHAGSGLLDQPISDATEALAGVAGRGPGVAPQAGRKVGPYSLVREIGRGGMGVVFLAEDARHARQAAIKVLAPHLSADPQARRRLLAEARAASGLDHPNICEILEVSETDDGQLFLAMPFYEGVTVGQRLADEGPLPAEEAVRIALEAARGLARAHSTGIIHRDIKPSNLMLPANGGVKILDFGVAKLHGSSLSDPGVRVGTLAYMAPEQILAQPVSPATDLWALGVTLYEMLAGRRPFQGDYEPAVLYEILNEAPRPLREYRPDAPVALERLLARLLEKDPHRRLHEAEELCEHLEAFQRGEEMAVAGSATGNLSPPLTEFFGRDRELEWLQRNLPSQRLITLTGPGGCGKTRLALEAARRVASQFSDGAWQVSLALVRDPQRLSGAILDALDIEPSTIDPPRARLIKALSRSNILLLLDNCEQIPGLGLEVSALLGACPGLHVLATSRTPLRIEGERELPVPPLEPPAGASPGAEPEAVDSLAQNQAVALFLDRARSARPDFALTDTNAESVAALCSRLDGLPLAIELAAARVKLFSAQALLERLERRLDLLSAGGEDRPERHRTLRNAFQWSYDLLSPDLAAAFRRLAVFRGGWDLAAAEAVCGMESDVDTIDTLEALLEQNLVRRDPDRGTEPRFSLLESIRELALERLRESGEEDAVRAAHADYYRALAQRAAAELTGEEQAAHLDELDLEYPNLEGALRWTLEQGLVPQALAFCGALWRFWLARGRIAEGSRYFEQLTALDLSGQERRAHLEALNGWANLLHNLGESGRAAGLLDECLEVWRGLGDTSGLAAALTNRAWVSCELSRFSEAEELSQEALELHRRAGDHRGQALAWNNLGWCARYRGDLPAAKERFERSRDFRRRTGDRRGEGYALTALAWVAVGQGRPAEAHRLLDQATRRLLPVGDHVLIGYTLTVRSMALLDEQRLDEAASMAQKTLLEWRRGGNRSGLAWSEMQQGEIDVERGRERDAVPRLEEARRIWRSIESHWGEALTLALLARAHAALGDEQRAREAARESLRLALDIGAKLDVANAVEILAALARESGRGGERRWVAAAAALRAICGGPRPLRRLQPPPADPGLAGLTESQALALAEKALDPALKDH